MFSVSDSLPTGLVYMRENDFSQIVIKLNDKFVILSAEGIFRWLERKSSDDVISLLDTKIGDAFRVDDV
jgi:hypothetical protein